MLYPTKDLPGPCHFVLGLFSWLHSAFSPAQRVAALFLPTPSYGGDHSWPEIAAPELLCLADWTFHYQTETHKEQFYPSVFISINSLQHPQGRIFGFQVGLWTTTWQISNCKNNTSTNYRLYMSYRTLNFTEWQIKSSLHTWGKKKKKKLRTTRENGAKKIGIYRCWLSSSTVHHL